MKQLKLNTGTFTFLLLCLISAFSTGYTQNKKLDSLKQLLAHSKNDTTTSRYLWRISKIYLEDKNDEDSTLFYASQGYDLAVKHTFLKGMWVNLSEQCFVYERQGNYQKTLRLFLEFLKLCEEKRDKQQITRVLQLISDVYSELGDYQQAILYDKKNTSNIIESNIGGGWLNSNYYSIGNAYINLHQPDSALTYFQQGFALASKFKTNYRARGWLDQMLVGLGMANQQLGNYDIAAAYYNDAIKYEEENKHEKLYYAYLQKAGFLQEMNQVDSSITYYVKALQTIKGNVKDLLGMYKALANIYLKKDLATSVKYFTLEQKLRDSLFTSDNVKAIQALTFNEQERQIELINSQKEEEEANKQNIENSFITISIISFLILFLLLSRSIIVNEKWIRFLGVVGLLVLFEFINLLLHPRLEKLTHHSPTYMLLIMVGIAALLVPLHHKTEKWVTKKMVEKNKSIRLAAAKKTIEQLGGKTEM